jgi:Cu+-exporting ATPase
LLCEHVHCIDISIESKSVSVKVTRGYIQALEIVRMIEELGFNAIYQPLDVSSSLETGSDTTLLHSSSDLEMLIPVNIDKKSVTLKIEGMTCSSCVASIERKVHRLPGILDCKVALLAERADIVYDANIISDIDLIRAINECGFTAQIIMLERGQVRLSIYGMTCASCARTIEVELMKMPGIVQVSINLLLQTGDFIYQKSITGIRDIIHRIESLGFNAIVSENVLLNNAQLESLKRVRETRKWKYVFMVSLILTLPVMVICMLLPIFTTVLNTSMIVPGLSISNFILLVFATAVQFLVARIFYVKAFRSIIHGTYTMDVLVALGSGISYIFSIFALSFAIYQKHSSDSMLYFDTACMLVTFISLGRYLESSAKGKTSDALASLMSLAPSNAILIENGVETTIPTEYIQLADILKILPGERFPVDGIVTFGKSSVDESMVTGESTLVPKNVGVHVISGTINKTGLLHMRATRVGSDTAISQMIKVISDAQTSKAPMQQLADKISGIFVPIVVFLGMFTFWIWTVLIICMQYRLPNHFKDASPFFTSLSFGIAVIVVACPCALGLATPTAMMVGTGVGAENGILIKNGQVVENATKITKVFLDKTGTLTVGKPVVIDTVLDNASGWNLSEFYHIVGAAESSSEHPLGKAIYSHAKTFEPSKITYVVSSFQAIAGAGIDCLLDGQDDRVHVLIGNYAWMYQNHISIDQKTSFAASRRQVDGCSVAYVAINSQFIGFIALSDELKEDALLLVEGLKQLGIRAAIMTGDNEDTARTIGRKCGITEIYAEITPSGKRSVVAQAQERGEKVMMVGDGVNDSAALAQADIGIAVYGGTDVAIEAADVVLMKSNLTDILTTVHLCRQIHQKIIWNFLWASI